MPTDLTVYDICLPPINICNPGGGGPAGNPYFIDCAETWNNIKCRNDKCYFMPYEEGETFYYQNPAGIDLTGISITDLDGVPIVGAIWSLIGSAPTQQVSIYVPPGTGCFMVTNEHPRGDTCISWAFEPVKDCRKTVKIRGLYENGEKDCFGITYPIDNSIRLYGYLVEGDRSVIEKTMYGNRVKRRKVSTYWTLYLDALVSRDVHRVLAKQIFSANQVEITYEGYIYTFITDDSITLQRQQMKNQMWYYGTNLQLKDVCEVAGVC